MYKPKIQMGTSSCIISVFARISLGEHQNLSRHQVWNVSPDTFTQVFPAVCVFCFFCRRRVAVVVKTSEAVWPLA